MSASATQSTTTFVPSVFLDAPKWDHAGLPEWFVQSRLSAWEQFTNLPVPHRKDENWRFANLSLLQFDGFHRLAAVPVPEARGLAKTAARVVTVNDAVVSCEASQVAGLEVLSLRDALERHGERLRPFLTVPDTGLGGARFAALHHAQLADAVVMVVAPGTEVADPVEIVHWLSGDHATGFPRTIVLAGERARLAVVEHHLSAGSAPVLSCGATQIDAAAGAAVTFVQFNRHHAAGSALNLVSLRSGRDAQVKHASFNIGLGYVRSEVVSRVAGEGGRSDMLSVSVAADGQETDQRTLQDHLVPHTGSDLLYKHILFGKARTIFAGLIRVDEGAHFTDAYQKCRNLLLSDECEANSMPGLEINADQVKCSHGSTSGRLSEEEVFYLLSRGIPREAAEHMMSLGFALEVVERLGQPAVEAMAVRLLAARLAEIGV
jgi:Fe-S cluster assembly protein SufD